MEEELDKIALKIFNEYQINRDNEIFNIAELEIYLYDINNINQQDIFCHKSELQKTKNSIYFHYSGFDITYGDENKYCGILIRGIENEKGKFIYGPGRIAYKFPGKIKRDIRLIINKKNNYTLNKNEIQIKNIIHKLPRINLSRKIINHCYYKDYENLKYYYNLKARYLRLPDKNIFDINLETIPEGVREITDLLWE